MFSQDISREDRLKAVQTRIEASKFEGRGPSFASAAHERLDRSLAEAPDWLIDEMSRLLFGRCPPLNELEVSLKRALEPVGLDHLAWAASQVRGQDARPQMRC